MSPPPLRTGLPATLACVVIAVVTFAPARAAGPDTRPVKITLGQPAATRPSGATEPFPSTAPATQPATPASAATRKAIETLENYYAELYAKPFRAEANARLAHLVAITSLSRIDGPALTRKLMLPLAFGGKQDPVVTQVAWEALRARATSLTSEQRRQWLDAGLKAVGNGAFPGATAAGLVAALSTRPVEAAHLPAMVKLLARLAEENDPATPHGKEALDAAARAIAAWGNKDLVRRVVDEMGGPKVAGRNGRLAALLAALPEAPAEATPAAWKGWLASPAAARLKANLATLAAGSESFAAPERIVDPTDRKWIKEAELGDLRLSKLDLIFCVDGTGSMQASNEFVTRYVRSVYLALGTISASTRAGAVYYRHETNPAVMLDCCRKAVKARDMTVHTIKPVPEPDALLAAMRAMLPAPGTRVSGHGGDGAYYGALETASKVLGPAEKGSARVIVCIGDAKMTPGAETKMVELGKSLKAGGYICIFLNRDPWSAENLAATSLAASGEEPVVYRDDVIRLKDGGDVYDEFESSAFGEMCARAIRASIPPAYGDRAKPMLSAVWKVLVAGERAREAKARM